MSIQTKIYLTTIGGLQQAIEQHTITSPTMLIIGPVVSLAQEMELKYA